MSTNHRKYIIFIAFFSSTTTKSPYVKCLRFLRVSERAFHSFFRNSRFFFRVELRVPRHIQIQTQSIPAFIKLNVKILLNRYGKVCDGDLICRLKDERVMHKEIKTEEKTWFSLPVLRSHQPFNALHCTLF